MAQPQPNRHVRSMDLILQKTGAIPSLSFTRGFLILICLSILFLFGLLVIIGHSSIREAVDGDSRAPQFHLLLLFSANIPSYCSSRSFTESTRKRNRHPQVFQIGALTAGPTGKNRCITAHPQRQPLKTDTEVQAHDSSIKALIVRSSARRSSSPPHNLAYQT